MLKKILIRCWRAIVCMALLIILVDIGLHLVSRTEWFKTRVTQAVQQALNRDIKLARMGADLRGIFMNNFAVAEQGGFENGTFVQAKQLRIRISLIHLLHGHIKIQLISLADATVQATIKPDGSASWQDLVTASQQKPAAEETAEPFPFRVTATHIRLENTQLIYVDKTGPHSIHVDGLTIGVSQFRLNEPFPFYMYAKITPTVKGKTLSVPLVVRGTADLKNLDLAQAFVEIQTLSASYKKAVVSVRGRVENFTNPQLYAQMEVRNLSSEKLADLAALPAFNLERAALSLKGAVNLEKAALTLHHLAVNAPGVELTAKGGLLYENPDALIYDLSSEGTIVLGETGRWLTALAEPYRLVGTINTQTQATQKQISGKIHLDDVGIFFPEAGQISNVTTQVNFEEAMNFKTGKAEAKLAGKVNGHPFTSSLKAIQKPEKLDIQVHLKAQEIFLPSSLFDKVETDEKNTSAQNTAVAPKAAWPLPPITVKADITVDKLEVPYFYGTDVAFKADMSGLSPDLKQAHGDLRLSAGDGKIQDVYKLTNANPLTKVLFLSLNITGKVFNSLNVFDVLGSIGGGIANAVTGDDKPETEQTVYTQTILGPDGEPLEVPVVKTNKKIDGEMMFDKFATSVNFVRGLATVKEGIFVSPMMSFRLSGTTDFNTQQVDLTVHAAPGRHEADGMMPLTLTIGGTVDNPQGSMALLGSVTSLVTQSVTNNAVSRQVGKGIKGFFGLFQKKKEPVSTEPKTVPAN